MSPLATWIVTHRARLGLTTHALGKRSGVSDRLLYFLESRPRRRVSARTLLQLATFFKTQDQTADVSLPTLLALAKNQSPRGHRAAGSLQPQASETAP